VFVLLWAAALSGLRRPMSGILALALIPLLAATALSSPIEVSSTLRSLVNGIPVTPPQPDPGTIWGPTPGLWSALQWMHDRTPVGTVFAVSNHWIDPAKRDGRNFYYSAFRSDRCSSKAMTPSATEFQNVLARPLGTNYTYRQELNDALFNHADVNALQVLTQQYGVRFLFVDRIHGATDAAVLQLGCIVYRDSDAIIVDRRVS
jgi:hypothetical protein